LRPRSPQYSLSRLSAWQGLLAPTGTPPEIVAKFHAALTRVLGLAEVRDKLRVQAPIRSTTRRQKQRASSRRNVTAGLVSSRKRATSRCSSAFRSASAGASAKMALYWKA
jgi:hypothetical protein